MTTTIENLGNLEQIARHYRDEYVQHWGDWLYEFKWDMFVSLTFRDIPPELRAKGVTRVTLEYMEEKWKKLLHKLKILQGSAPYWARVTENSMFREAPHFHALIGGVSEVNLKRIGRLWGQFGGHAKIERYNRDENGTFYVAKSHDTLRLSNIDFVKFHKELI